MKLLFTNSGRRTYMIKFAKKIRNTKICISDSDKNVPSFFMKGVKKFILPKVKNNETKYINKLLFLVKKIRINVLIPLSDHDLLILSKNKNLFNKLGCEVIISDSSFISNCLNKKKMYFYCKKNNIPTPTSYFSKNKKNFHLSLIKKKINSSGSVGMKFLSKNDSLNNFDFKNFFLQKRIIGTEYGLDIFNHPVKKISRISIKKKFLMRSGETDRCILVNDKSVNHFAKKLLKIFNHYGNVDCDIIKDKKGKLFLIDINPRFGGGYPSTHLAGFNYLKYILTDGKYALPKKYYNLVVSKGISIHTN